MHALEQRTEARGHAESLPHGPDQLRTETVDAVLHSPGLPLGDAVQPPMEAAFGTDFGDVRIHSDAAAARSAAALGARAYTIGEHVVLGHGAGHHTLVHELAHVVQQRGAAAAPGPLALSRPGDASERAADAAAHQVASGGRAAGGLMGTSRRQVARDTGNAVGETPYNGDGRHQSNDTGFASAVGRTDAVRLRNVGTLSAVDRMEVNGKLRWFDGKAHNVYEALVRPVLASIFSGKAQAEDSEPFTDAQRERMGQVAQVNTLFEDFAKLKDTRIAAWKGAAEAKEPKPGRAILDTVVAMVALGMGGVFGEIVAHGIKGKLLNEFVLLAGLEVVDKLSVDSYEWAMDTARDTFQEGTKKGLEEFKEVNLTMALSDSNFDDMIGVYVEAMSLQAQSEKFTLQGAFNSNSKVTYRKGALTLIGVAMRLVFHELWSDPKVYHRELTEGYLRMLDEAHVETVANKNYGGDKARARREDEDLHETDERKGNLILLTSSEEIGDYWAPRLDFPCFNALGTGANTQTFMKLADTHVRDLKLTLGFRYWGISPLYRIISGDWVRIWFTRDPGGDVYLGPEVGEDAEEWLASYYTGIRRELTDVEREANARPGAKKLYEATKDKPIHHLVNSDFF